MIVNTNENVIIFNKKEIEAIDLVREMTLEIIFDIRTPDEATTVNDVVGELWNMRKSTLDRIGI